MTPPIVDDRANAVARGQAGEHALIPGVPPVTTRMRLALLAAKPLSPSKPQKPLETERGACARARAAGPE